MGQQVRQDVRGGDVVDGDDLDRRVLPVERGAQDISSDAAETVDGDSGGHRGTPARSMSS
ncbi:hypothetical protein PV646_19750 [Streptomyces sp. ID05-26A]|nr:hypothetical protein [Streptomyces sp. ID05-26A]